MWVDRSGWDSAEILHPVTLPLGGAEMGEHFAQIIFHFFYCYINIIKRRILTHIYFKWMYVTL